MKNSIKVRKQYVTSFLRLLLRGVPIMAFVVALTVPMASRAQVVMTNNDALGTTSFNAAGWWNNGAAPSGGNTYDTDGYLLRSPTTVGSYTFAGNSLTIGTYSGGSGATAFSPVTANNDCFIVKIGGGSTYTANWILDGGQIRDGLANGDTYTIGGTIAITANGGALLCQATQNIAAAISGSSVLYIGDHGAGNNSNRIVVIQSALNTFNGNVVLTNSANNAYQSLLDLAPNSVWNFKPKANGVNNSISGTGTLWLNGDLAFDLSTADNTVGDTWQIIAPATSSFVVNYGATFSINGFTQNGMLWDDYANNVDYEFNQATGALTVVPEPSTVALIGLGLGCCGLLLRRNHKRP